MSLDTTKSTDDLFANSDPTGMKKSGSGSPMKSSGATYPKTSSTQPEDQIQSMDDAFAGFK